MSLPLGTDIDRYTIRALLGEGGFGVTYKAIDSASGGWVALKENYPRWLVRRDAYGRVLVTGDERDYQWALKHFLDEAGYLCELHHPNIVKVYRAFEANGTAYFAMEYLNGAESLKKICGKSGWPAKKLEGMLRQVLSALSYMHSRSVYHRDIKPDNIMWLEREARAVLIDFGAAKGRISDDPYTRGFVSLGYTPLEQLEDSQYLSPSVDIYALGATMHCLLRGGPPDPATKRHIKDNYRPLAQDANLTPYYPHALLQSIDKALCVNVEGRHASARAWERALCASYESNAPQRVFQSNKQCGYNAPSKHSQRTGNEPSSKGHDSACRPQRSGAKAFSWFPVARVCLYIGLILLAVIFISLFSSTTGDYWLDSLFPVGLLLTLVGIIGALCQRINGP